MFVYIFILCFIWLFVYKSKEYNAIKGLLIILLLYAFCALRDEHVGTDTERYINSYLGLGINKYEQLFNVISEYIFVFSGNPNVYLAIISLFIFIPLFIFLRLEKVDVVLALLVYYISTGWYYLETYNAIRQSVALSIVLLFYYFLKNDKYFVSFVLMVFAVNIHTSALLGIFPAIFRYIKIRREYGVLILLVSLIIGYYNLIDVRLLIDSIYGYQYNNIIDLSRYIYQSEYLYYFKRNIAGFIVGVLPTSILCLYLLFKYPIDFYSRIYFWGAVLTNIVISLPIAHRLTSYYRIVEIVLLPLILEKEKSKNMIMIIFFWFVSLSAFFVYRLWRIDETTTNKINSVVPYEFFF